MSTFETLKAVFEFMDNMDMISLEGIQEDPKTGEVHIVYVDAKGFGFDLESFRDFIRHFDYTVKSLQIDTHEETISIVLTPEEGRS